jgi:hypothetical protein
MRVRLVGDNARYLARHWQASGFVESSDDEDIVECYPKPNAPGADVLYDSYLMRLGTEARGVGVGLTLEDNTQILWERVWRSGAVG